MGPVHFFAVDSEDEDPSGNTSNSVQGQWLHSGLASSTSPYDLVYFHRPPYTSGPNGPYAPMQWPFESWGATAVLNGHDHDYERILRDDNGDGVSRDGRGDA